ncbi:hypothetical protein AAC387_Pa11g0274 [Persea americana]
MAGLVVASAVLKELLSTLRSHVLDEFWLLWGVEKEKDKLQSNLETINAVLQDAERRQVNEMAVKNWLRKIKAAAHDAEDVLDEFGIEDLRRKVENQAAGMRKKVGKLFYPPVFRFKMAHKMQKLRKNFEHFAKERSLFHFTVGVVDSQPPISKPRETCSAIVSEVYGRDTEKANLIDLLTKSESENKENLSVIPIVGMGGVGKTTLAQLVYNDKQVVARFELRMWVYVPENFDVGMLLKEILQSAIDGPIEQLSMELLQTRLQKQLSGKRYLLVLDDVWNENRDEWDRLKALLTCGANGSKLLVTTRHDAVAKIMHAVPRSRLGTLSNEESWNLFQKLANPPPMCVAIGQEMVKQCAGLPLAIRTLGRLMSSKETASEWESVRDSELWNSQDNGGRILPTLQLSYDHLIPSLKQCFAYCAVIPKGRSFAKHKLFQQWIALGFIHSDEENELLEEKAEESRAGIEELKGLNQLCGDFCIRRLNHVRNGECAREANLKAKKHLHSLKLSWLSDHGTAADTEGNSEEAVIENLEPHARLKKLAVKNYMDVSTCHLFGGYLSLNPLSLGT